MSNGPKDRAFLLRDSVANLIRMISLLAIALGVFAMAAGGGMVYLNLDSELALERADRAASQQARRVADQLADIQVALRDASVVDAARSGEEYALRESLRDRGIVNILEIRILPARIDALASGADDGLSFDVTEFVIEAVRDGRAETRVLQPGTPAESLAFAERLPGNAGVLLLRLTVSALLQGIEAGESLDFVALAQRIGDGSTILTARGESTTGPIRNEPIEGSSLQLNWARAVVASPLDTRASVIIALSGLIAMMLGLLLRRRTRLARYLEAAESASRPAPWSPGAQSPSNRADDTMVLARQNPSRSARSKEDSDGADKQTVVADSPDLPDWLLDETGETDPDRN